MSDMIIEILNVSIETVEKGNKSYQVANIAFKNKTFQDKVEGKKVMSFAEKEAFSTLKDATTGQVFNVTREKNAAGYWAWKTVTPATGEEVMNTNQAIPNVNKTPKSTYETPEERAARQILIVRQSSIASAVEFVNGLSKNSDHTVDNVISVAHAFEQFVFGKDPIKEIVNMTDDIPM
jgi:hypothetical protein